MKRHPWKRLAAWGIDCCLILVYAGVIALVGVPLYRAGMIPELPQWLGNAVAAVVLVVPVVLALAGLEASPKAATIGKRAVRLRIIGSSGGRVSYRRAAMRNLLKLGVPWLIGHAAVYALSHDSAGGSVPGWAWLVLALAYVIPIIWIGSLFVLRGRTPYDRWTRTAVVDTESP